MNNSPINSTINSTMVVELADATSLKKMMGSRKESILIIKEGIYPKSAVEMKRKD